MLQAALATLLALVPTQGGAQPSPPDLRGSSIVLVEGIRGGIIGPTRHRTLVFGYDWNARAFRAVEQRLSRDPTEPGRVFQAGDLERDRFQRLVEQLLELGLPALPLEQPAACEDLYDRNTGIRFVHGGRSWENQAPGGCQSWRSSVQPTQGEVERFDAVRALLERTFAEGPLQPASALAWLPCNEWSEPQRQALATAVELLRERGSALEWNANEATFLGADAIGLHLRLPGRNAQPFTSDRSTRVIPPGSFDLWFAPGTDRVVQVRETPVASDGAADVARRRAFVEAHPELPAAARELVLAGWVGDGMSEAQIRAAWGEPLERRQDARHAELTYARAGVAPGVAEVTLSLYGDRLLLRW
jgi:hypothetical protein